MTREAEVSTHIARALEAEARRSRPVGVKLHDGVGIFQDVTGELGARAVGLGAAARAPLADDEFREQRARGGAQWETGVGVQERGVLRVRRHGYSIRVSSLNIGRYIAMTIVPTMMPTPIIRIGSMIEVSDWMLASTSSS